MELEKTDLNITMESTDTDTDTDMVMDTAMDLTKNNSHVNFFPIIIGYGHILSQESIVEELCNGSQFKNVNHELKS